LLWNDWQMLVPSSVKVLWIFQRHLIIANTWKH